jgi:type II secretory pathway component PulL
MDKCEDCKRLKAERDAAMKSVAVLRVDAICLGRKIRILQAERDWLERQVSILQVERNGLKRQIGNV